MYSFADLYRDTGEFGVYIGTSKAKVRQTLDMVLAELRAIKSQPLPPEEIANAKAQLKGNLMLGMESTSNRMMRLAKMELHLEPYFTIDEARLRIDRVTEADIERVFHRVLQPEHVSLAVLGPVNPKQFSLEQLQRQLV